MQLSGLVTGTLGYSLKREFLANAIALTETENYSYEVYSIDSAGLSANTIQSQIKAQFSNIYSGDITVKVLTTEHTQGFPSDSIRAAKYVVDVEIKKDVANLGILQPELTSGFYSGLDTGFFANYATYLLDFKENFTFETNTNGNREFNHDISFGLRTGWSGSYTTDARRLYAQGIASGIFAQDQNTTFGILTMIGLSSGIANTGIFRNYFNESYDLMKNVYGFSRKRELLPTDGSNVVINQANSLTLNSDGTIDVSEKANTQGKIDFTAAKSGLETFYSGSYSRCEGFYNSFANTSVAFQDPQYSGTAFFVITGLSTFPTKLVKNYDARSLTMSYDVTYTDNPTLYSTGILVTQVIDVNIDTYDKVEASHSYDFIVNRINNSNNMFVTAMNALTGASPSYMSGAYRTSFVGIANEYPNFNLIKTSVTWPNIGTKGSAKFFYSNNPTFFYNYDGLVFKVLDYTIENKKPSDMVNEYKIVNRPSQMSVLSYAYQTDKGVITINIKVALGKQSQTFYPDGVGTISTWNGLPLSRYLQAVYKLGGSLLMGQFNIPTTALNWFISDSKYNFDSEGNLNLQLEYTYTIKKRTA